MTVEALGKACGPAGAGVLFAWSIGRFHYAGHFFSFGALAASSLLLGLAARLFLPRSVEEPCDDDDAAAGAAPREAEPPEEEDAKAALV